MRFQPRPTTDRLPPIDPFGNSTEELRIRERAPTLERAINTKAVGVNPRGSVEAEEISEHRQKALEYIQSVGPDAFCNTESGILPGYWLKLVEEPSNLYDSDAVKVMLYSRAAEARGRREGVQLGYIANGERVCTNPSCRLEYERPRTSAEAILVCTSCGHPTQRNGLASQLKSRAAEAGRTVQDYYNVTIAWDAGGITGGGTRTHGCNIRIQVRS